MCIIYPVDHKGYMQSSYRDPEHNNVLDKSSLETSECIRWLKNYVHLCAGLVFKQ